MYARTIVGRKVRTLADVESFGERLARLRAEAGITATELAFRAGKSENWLRRLEAGTIEEPSFAAGCRMARALGVRADYLATGEGPKSRSAGSATLAGVPSIERTPDEDTGLAAELRSALQEAVKEVRETAERQAAAIEEQRAVNTRLEQRLADLEAARQKGERRRNHSGEG